jgi:hypothetical protein
LSLLVPFALFGWIPIVLLLFFFLPVRWATALAFAIGWCYLPMAGYTLPGLPDYTKTFATCVGALLGISLFNPILFFTYRASWLDVAPLMFCLSPFLSSTVNGLGVYDGISAAFHQSVAWGLPYLIGRLVYRSSEELFPLTASCIGCGLSYVPLCLWEIRMSPQLHAIFYGFHQHSFAQTMRGGGWRPTVFMEHGLQVSLWMGFCLLLGYIGWRILPPDSRPKSLSPILLSLGVTFVLLKSLGAFVLVVIAIVFFELVRLTGSRLLYLILPICVISYLLVRGLGLASPDTLISFIRDNVSIDRAESLQFRIHNEDVLAEKARQQVWFGWGGWGRNRVFDENGKDLTVTDGLWIIIFGTQGLVGLSAFYAMQLTAPTWRLLSGYFRNSAPTIGLALGCVISTIDTLPNAMTLPIFQVVLGALVHLPTRNRFDYDPSRKPILDEHEESEKTWRSAIQPGVFMRGTLENNPQ